MIISFDVNNQIISRTDENRVVSKSVNYLIAKFSFSEDWNKNSLITPLFISSDKKAYTPELRTDGKYIDEEGCCFVPHEALEAGGILLVSVTEYNGDLKKRITANTAVVHVEESGETTAQTSMVPTPSVYEQIMSDYIEVKNNALMNNNTDLKLTDRLLQLTANGEAVGKGIDLPRCPVVNMIDVQENIVLNEQGVPFGGDISIILPNLKAVGYGIVAGKYNSDGIFIPGKLYNQLPPIAQNEFALATNIGMALYVEAEDTKMVLDKTILGEISNSDATSKYYEGIYQKARGGTDEEKVYLFCGVSSENGEVLQEMAADLAEYLKNGKKLCVSFIPFDEGGAENG